MAIQKISTLQINTAGSLVGQSISVAANGNAYWANVSGGDIGPAFDKANAANYFAYVVNANTIAAFNQANLVAGAVTTANSIAVAAFAQANTKYSASGGTINGDVSISGNLSLTGNTVFNNVATFVVNDPLIYLAGNNYTSDIVDIGFIANYVNATGSNVHTGLLRDAGNKEYYVFEGYDKEPINNVVDVAGNNFTISVLNATLKTSNIMLGGINALSWIRSSYDTTNLVAGAVTTANSTAVAAFGRANSAQTIAIAAFAQANTGGGGGSFTGGTVANATTFLSGVTLNSTLTAASSVGTAGQALISTGSGVNWSSLIPTYNYSSQFNGGNYLSTPNSTDLKIGRAHV